MNLNMFPPLFVDNVANHRVPYVVLPSKFVVSNPSIFVAFSNLKYLFICKFRARRSLAYRIGFSALLNCITIVISISPQKEMFKVLAKRIITFMTNTQPFGYFSFIQRPTQPMSSPSFLTNFKTAIFQVSTVYTTSPKMAAILIRPVYIFFVAFFSRKNGHLGKFFRTMKLGVVRPTQVSSYSLIGASAFFTGHIQPILPYHLQQKQASSGNK